MMFLVIHHHHVQWPGGRAPVELTAEEGLFSFEFPEKPGALMKFLEQLPPGPPGPPARRQKMCAAGYQCAWIKP